KIGIHTSSDNGSRTSTSQFRSFRLSGRVVIIDHEVIVPHELEEKCTKFELTVDARVVIVDIKGCGPVVMIDNTKNSSNQSSGGRRQPKKAKVTTEPYTLQKPVQPSTANLTKHEKKHKKKSKLTQKKELCEKATQYGIFTSIVSDILKRSEHWLSIDTTLPNANNFRVFIQK
ncbi:6330_t:CDS:2, partial [Rhizophagus irregularis]